MSLSLQESFDRSCRLCAEEQDVTILIFSAEAEAMHLQNKLNKYLLIEIDEDDKLPKNICIQCCSKLQTVCDFIETARKSQETLIGRSMLLDNLVSNTFSQDSDLGVEIKTEPLRIDEDESHDTEMEVSVDPMMVLQNSEPRIDELNNMEDVTYLHGADGEDVTIKLIRRGDAQEPPEVLTDDMKKDPLLKPFPCLICKRSYYSELALKNHSWIHIGESKSNNEFSCHSCNAGFLYRMDLINHLKDHRSNSTCILCGRVFRSEANLEIHMESHKSPQNAHVCKICGRAYDKISNLKTHSITHSTERPFKCHLCKKSFKRNQDLKFHINQHTGAKPYKCPFCEKCFASSGNCYSHRSRMHPGRRLESKATRGRRRLPPASRDSQTLPTKLILPNKMRGVYKYQCNLCNHSFMKRDNYTYHMYQHTGEKPFQCKFCTEKFVTRKGLFLHHDKEHPTMERPLALISNNALLK